TGPAETIGQSALSFVHPEDLPSIEKAFAKLVKSPGIAPVEFRFRRKNGSWCPLEAVGTNLLDDPTVHGIVVNSRDNTVRKQLENALRESEERYALAMSGANDGAICRLVGSQSDIGLRKEVEERLLHDALHDALTGLPNRALFVDRVKSCFSRLQRHKEFLFSVLFLDLDRFKMVNDGLGHV